MAKSLTQKICDAIKGEGIMPTDGLADYHAAQAVKSALRRRDPQKQLIGVREALKRYRVTAWFKDEAIELRKNGVPVLTL